MKNIVLLLLLFSGIIQGQIVTIPDTNFKAKLLLADVSNEIAYGATDAYIKIDANNNGEIEVDEAQAITRLYIQNSGITSLAGIESFTNVSVLNCSDNPLGNIDFSAFPNLTVVKCLNSELTQLNVVGLSNLKYLDCSNNQLSTLNLSGLTSITDIYCASNQLTDLDVSSLSTLAELHCSNNQLTTMTVAEHNKYIDCSFNQLTAINLAPIAISDPITLVCSNNPLLEINFGPVNQLQYLTCSNTAIANLDLTGQNLKGLICTNNANLTTLLIKAAINLDIASSTLTTLEISNNPNLRYVCASDNYLGYVASNLDAMGQTNYVLNTYCSFVPGGSYNTIKGAILFDIDNNGCDVNDFATPYMKVSTNDGLTQRSTFTYSAGNYTFYTQTGTFSIAPEIENPGYFSISPANALINFSLLNSIQTQDFCISANGIHPDIEVVMSPTAPLISDSDVNYKIAFKNKGNQIQSGNVTLNFDSSILDFVSTVPEDNFILNPNQIIWNYNALKPFETRNIDLTLHALPTVQQGDILHFTMTANPTLTDETPSDNTFSFHQKATNSGTGNSIECIEGATISTEAVGRFLHYNVNFENIGTAEVYNIVIKDTINTEKFDINSLQLQYASHNVETRVTGNIVEFILKNINLPSALSNPIGGHGNVLFKIKTLPTLVENDELVGNANIFFDFNAPIQTNDARTIISALSGPNFIRDKTISVAPNPVKNIVMISSKNNIKSVQLFDAQGRILQTVLENKKTSTLDISNKSNGIYFLKITSEVGSSVEKLVKEN